MRHPCRVKLRDFLETVGRTYDPAAGFNTSAQALLRSAQPEFADYAPTDFVIRASGGQRPLRTTDTPWVGFFDPDESTGPQEGLYVVWLLRADRQAWTLSINMVTERRSAQLKEIDAVSGTHVPREPRVRAGLAAEALAIRERMDPELTLPWETAIDLASNGRRQRRYEEAAVVARTYLLAALPTDDALRSDLAAICRALEDAIRAKRELALTEPGLISTSSAVPPRDDREYAFSPGTDVETVVQRRSIVRRPRHEGGLQRYGEWLISTGAEVATNVYPRDFIVRGEVEWIGEYKVVYGANAARATREAHSQLREYRYFGYPADASVRLLAVFSSEVTDRRVAWLNSEGIAVVWWTGARWAGCPLARTAALGT
jgi:hypothetical protein